MSFLSKFLAPSSIRQAGALTGTHSNPSSQVWDLECGCGHAIGISQYSSQIGVCRFAVRVSITKEPSRRRDGSPKRNDCPHRSDETALVFNSAVHNQLFIGVPISDSNFTIRFNRYRLEPIRDGRVLVVGGIIHNELKPAAHCRSAGDNIIPHVVSQLQRIPR